VKTKNKTSEKNILDGSTRPSGGKRDHPDYRKRVYDIVRRIPAGRVMTYGQIANMLGEGYTPRTVGYVMHATGDENVPWQRVINSQGACSTGRIILPTDMQQRILESEGVVFDSNGRCDLDVYRCLIDIDEIQDAINKREKPPSLFRRTSRPVERKRRDKKSGKVSKSKR
jgi:methylated-DNA-protein-cysteine methyltransferase-like protein